ncbi:helix-turn-helix transcriptional regulator [Natrinema halophilum]|uniref:Helix-turn-helix transcriptional regulator n=1 Tax=Natrinema halophilum TaxID=1699371 RepID=A0A7D5GJU3_9EURY|nr:helix-turn-helix transcriptional regulator [Natrinema halophilum]QLG48690.1 ArsR family transcriptional regulator [Natrinema halophilum]
MSDRPPEFGKNHRDTVDTALEALSHARRFQLLQSLREENPQEGVIASVTNSVESSRDLESAQIEMYHLHLPKLEKAGYIEWEQEYDQVSKGPEFDRIEELLGRVDGNRNDSLVFR